MKTVYERFWEKVEITPDCWNWKAAKPSDGYGRFWIDNVVMRSHRVSYEMLIGPIGNGLELDHLCRNRGCVNPSHLEAVTHQENMHRGYWATKTHCKHGHRFTVRNTLIRKDRGSRARECRACRKISDIKFKKANIRKQKRRIK